MYNFAISLNDTCKRFQRVAAVDRVCLMIETGENFSHLGSKCAVKSTNIEILITMMKLPSGMTLMGLEDDILKLTELARHNISLEKESIRAPISSNQDRDGCRGAEHEAFF